MTVEKLLSELLQLQAVVRFEELEDGRGDRVRIDAGGFSRVFHVDSMVSASGMEGYLLAREFERALWKLRRENERRENSAAPGESGPGQVPAAG